MNRSWGLLLPVKRVEQIIHMSMDIEKVTGKITTMFILMNILIIIVSVT